MQTRCVLCADAARTEFEKNGHPIFSCSGCGHWFSLPESQADHVEAVYGDDYFFGGKQGYPNYLDESALLRKRGSKYAKRIAEFTPPGTMLDVGAAAGFLLKGFTDAGWSGVGLEPNPGMVRYGTDELGLDMRRGTLEDFEADRTFDLVSMIQVVAHFRDIRRAFATLRDVTRDGGLLLIETWNRKSLTARLTGRRWHEYSPPSVLHWFDPAGLERVLEGFGFQAVKCGRTLKWISVRHALSLASYVLGDRSSESLQFRVSPSLAVPYPSEDLFWAVYQKSS